MRNIKLTNVKSHFEIKHINVNVHLKANLTASRKLFPIDNSSNMIGIH